MLTNIDFTKYKRFFAFGCSFTEYAWPTWADLLAKEIPDYYNFGVSGVGNQFIFNKLMQANVRYKFNTDDLVIIMWTNCAREDRYVGSGWIHPGNIYSQSIYDENFVKKFSCPRGYLIRDLATINATDIILNSIGCDYDFLSMVPVDQINQYDTRYNNDSVSDVISLYKSSIDKIKPSVFKSIYKNNWYTGDRIMIQYDKNHKPSIDPHPSPRMHLKYLKFIYPDIKFNDDTEQFAEKETIKLINLPVVIRDETYKFDRIRRESF
jgi:hypothetical protein